MDSTKKIPLGETKSWTSIKQSSQKTQYELKKEEVEALIKGVEIKQ
jgi:hypothetical protein